jgi:DNA helicase II / ATP-dependent DNA helicase PcrA
LENALKLNPDQMEAVRHVHGPMLIFAGAGSGKTRVITNRIVHLIQNAGVDPHKIVALSFTNKSAREMKERIRKMLPRKQTRGLELSTFHSLGLKMCKKFIDKLGYEIPFLLKAPSDIELLILEIYRKGKIDPKQIPIKWMISKMSFIKNTGEYPQSDGFTESSDEIEFVYKHYVEQMKNQNSLDFDDLILKPIELLESIPGVQDYYQKKFQFFMIDEFQDTNLTQYKFIKLLLGANPNLCVVGDDDQSIYGFRGSNRELILNFEKDFPNTKVVKLLQNYRSSIAILNAANSLIQKNSYRIEKQLWSEIYKDHKPFHKECQDELDEAYYVAETIQNLIIAHKYKHGQIAILFRTNYQSRAFEQELRMKSIPYKLIGAYNFFDRREVKDLLAYVRVIANPKDELSLMRILNYPKRGLGETSILKIQKKAHELDVPLFEVLLQICEQPELIPELKKGAASKIYEFLELIEKYRKEFYHGKMAETLKNLIKEVGFEKEFTNEEDDEKVIKARMLNLSEVVNMLAYFEREWEEENKPNLFDFLLRIALVTSDDEDESQEENRVQMMTMHLSKGLEFDCVFLVGLEEGILPSSRSSDTQDGIDEERRLLYVGITRARERLFFTSTQERKKFGETIPTTPSRFLEEIDSKYLDTEISHLKPTEELSFTDILEQMKAS